MPLKETLHGFLTEGVLEQVADLAMRRRRVLGSLVSLTYDLDPLISWRAVEAMGLACERIADVDPECVRQHLRRLHWLIMEESGGVCWRAPEAMAEIVCRRPQLLDEYVSIIVYQLREMAEEDLEHFRAGVLWGIGRLGSLGREHAADVLAEIAAALDDANPQVRGLAVTCLSAVGHADRVVARPDLLADEGPVSLYADRRLTNARVGDLARGVVDNVSVGG